SCSAAEVLCIAHALKQITADFLAGYTSGAQWKQHLFANTKDSTKPGVGGGLWSVRIPGTRRRRGVWTWARKFAHTLLSAVDDASDPLGAGIRACSLWKPCEAEQIMDLSRMDMAFSNIDS